MLLHLADEDEFNSPEAQGEIKAALSDKANIEIYSCPGCNHAFARQTGTHYNAIAATTANGRTWRFLADHLR
jgi:carboxymethylenebutenolidase